MAKRMGRCRVGQVQGTAHALNQQLDITRIEFSAANPPEHWLRRF